ncbi:MAG TPA: CADD family putative folate metabolism protein [Ignavibacteria bacterium]|nr:CADD family putative folate metabolism protein [Ignavibacteria bacterium]
MLSEEKFIAEVNSVIEKKSLLNHPFYQKWNEGTLSKLELQEYAKQYYHFVKHFPRFVSCVHSNCEDVKTRKILLENLADEEGFKTGIEDHPRLWINFAESLGLTEEEVKNAKPIREVEDMVDGMYELTRSPEFTLGLASLYAYESQVPAISRTKIDGLKKFYGIDSEKAIEFFSVHEEADVYHSKDEMDIIVKNNLSLEDQKRLINTVDESATLMWNFLDGVYNNYCVN